MPQTYPNQIRAIIDKPKLEDIKPFAYIDPEALWKAMNNLSGTEFKVYMRLMANAPNTEWWLSKVEIMEKTGISEPSYKKAIKGLCDKGYLEKGIAFHMFPKKDKENYRYKKDTNEGIEIIQDWYENDTRNNIKNNINNIDNNFLNASIEKVERPEGKDIDYSSYFSDFIF